MAAGFEVRKIGKGLYRIADALGNRAYLAVGACGALLVDTCCGVGDLRACVGEITSLPVVVVLTHGHQDHMMGSYRFEEVRLSPLDGGEGCWDLAEDHAGRVYGQVVREGLLLVELPFAPRSGERPRELPVVEGDLFDLGGRVVRAVALPGHTAGSMGYLTEDCGVLLSGDAVTPIMCLFSANSLSIQDWRDKTLARMAGLPFEYFYTGHHDHAFSKADLATFDAAGAYALTDRGMEWKHSRLDEFRGIIHLCPCGTYDTNSVDFRAVIDRWHELPPRNRGSRRSQHKEA